jgi:hypothetical protein
VVVGCVPAVILAELGVRMLRPEPPAVNVGVGSLRDERPSESYRSRRGEFDAWIEINSLGFHDREHSVENDGSHFRVVVLGDSFVEANQVELDDTWWSVLGEVLASAIDRPVEMIALGQGGASTAKAWQILQSYGSQYQPDVVLLAFCVGNDVFNNSHRLEDKRRKGPFFAVDADGGLVPVDNAEFEASLQRAWWPLWRSSHLYRRVVRAMHRDATLKRVNPSGFHVLFEVYLEQPPPVWEDAWEVTAKLIGEIAASTREAGAVPVVLVIPDRVQVHDEDWLGIVETYPGMAGQSWDLDRPNRLLVGILDELGIAFYDPTAELRGRAARGDRLYFREDIHFNEEANRVVGTLAGDFLARVLSEPEEDASAR